MRAQSSLESAQIDTIVPVLATDPRLPGAGNLAASRYASNRNGLPGTLAFFERDVAGSSALHRNLSEPASEISSMAHAVFTHSPSSRYDDLPEHRYHFPATYLNQVQSAKGDWIVYYEPRRTEGQASSNGRQAYFAVAFVQSIEADPTRPNHYYANLTGYFELQTPVPFKQGTSYFESILRKPDGSTSKGAFGRSVRALAKHEFEAIVTAGMSATLDALLQDREATEEWPLDIRERPVVELVTRRAFRDVAFRHLVRHAYANTCAITGLSLINGGGRPEVQAAHIRPVAKQGPDSLRNGVALTGTAHWLFDRGLISIGDDHELLVASKGVPDQARRLFREDLTVWAPTDPFLRPHPAFLAWHREHIFKG